jgi:hypothetical protein
MNLTRITFLSLLAAAPASAQRMIALDSNRSVYEVDIATGVRTLLGTVTSNVSTAAGLAYDMFAGNLYLTSTGNDSVYLIDQTNWRARLIGPYGDSAIVMHGLEWDSSTNTLYGMSSHNNGLYTISTTTGTATLVGQTGLTSFHNLGYDPVLDTMWMTNSGTDSFYSINRTTGAATLIGPLSGPTNPNGLAYNIDNLTLYLVDNSTDVFYTIDTTTGAATAVGPLGAGNYLGLAYLRGTGRMTRAAHGCGPTTVFVTGNPNIGGTVTMDVENTTGIPLVGFGLTNVGVPYCGCTIGHEWAVAVVGGSVPFTIPNDPANVGVTLLMQGVDFLGAGGCPDPMLTLTDTITVTIGL